jgi:hypothetical protein
VRKGETKREREGERERRERTLVLMVMMYRCVWSKKRNPFSLKLLISPSPEQPKETDESEPMI